MTDDERKVLVDALLAEIGTAQKYNSLVFDLQAEIERLRWRVMTLESAARWAKSQAKLDSSTNHDAAPAAKAVSDEARTDKAATSHRDDGTGDTPLDVEELLGELHHIAGSGDHVEYDIRRTACDAEHAIDRLRAWVNELQLSKVEVDALQHVVEDGRLFDMSDYGRLRSLLVRLRPEWEDEWEDEQDESDRPEPIERGPDPDSRVWETPAKTNPTPPRHGTPAEGSVQGEGSVPDSRTWNEPVAWWLKGCEYDTGCEYEYVSLVKEAADEAAAEGGTVTPLYRSPTLTDAEREAVDTAEASLMRESTDLNTPLPVRQRLGCAAATLRGLLERLK